jgi:hypothetical protein
LLIHEYFDSGMLKGQDAGNPDIIAYSLAALQHDLPHEVWRRSRLWMHTRIPPRTQALAHALAHAHALASTGRLAAAMGREL